jgi:hypothetical protein
MSKRTRWILTLAGALLLVTASLGVTKARQDSPQGSASSVVIGGQSYDCKDFGPFTPSGAIYFMDGTSEATVRVYATKQQMTFRFADHSTSIAGSAPFIYDPAVVQGGVFLPAPPPLRPISFFPRDTPPLYKRRTNIHLMQVVSMNMTDDTTGARLLIGYPYAEKYPGTFFNSSLFPEGDAASYGVVTSLVDTEGLSDDEIRGLGYPARSFFGVYHILETPMGVFFNKKATQMELQPDQNGKLALTLPPIPFLYSLINGPIPLYDINNPNGPAVAEVVAAAHGSDSPATFSVGSWPFNQGSASQAKLGGGGTRP